MMIANQLLQNISDKQVYAKGHNNAARHFSPLQLKAEIMALSHADSILNDWSELARNALEPSPFYEPDFLRAIGNHLDPKDAIKLVLIRNHSNRGALTGLFPITVKGVKKGFPKPVTALAMNSMMSTGTPLIRGEHAAEVWQCFLDFVKNHPKLPDVVYCQELHDNGPVGLALTELQSLGLAHKRRHFQYEKPTVRKGLDFGDYIKNWSKNKRRNILKRQRKMSDLGEVSYAFVHANEPAYGDNVQEFLELERAGWKGREGTAILSNANTEKMIKDIFLNPKHAAQIVLSELRLDGKMIAGAINLISHNTMFTYKGAYDEDLASYGPGILLDAWMLEQILTHPTLNELDSCTDANHPLREIWLDNKSVERCFITAPGPNSKILLDLTVNLRRSFLASWDIARDARQTPSRVLKQLLNRNN